jgi:hypothetical protein
MARFTRRYEEISACSRRQYQAGEAGHNLGGIATVAETLGSHTNERGLQPSWRENVLKQVRLKRHGARG